MHIDGNKISNYIMATEDMRIVRRVMMESRFNYVLTDYDECVGYMAIDTLSVLVERVADYIDKSFEMVDGVDYSHPANVHGQKPTMFEAFTHGGGTVYGWYYMGDFSTDWVVTNHHEFMGKDYSQFRYLWQYTKTVK